VVDLYGPTDLTRPMPLLESLGTFTALFGGATLERAPALYHDASPLFFVTPAAAPTLIVQGDVDTTVPPEQSRALEAALRAAGVPVQYASYAGGHGVPPALQAQMLRVEGDFLLAQT
jgi:dipeptidyl aminopeptidase/acylaminoacyl peptidase